MSAAAALPGERRTERLILRPLAQAAVDDVLAYRADADTCRYLPYGPRSREQVAHDLTTLADPMHLAAAADRAVYGLWDDPDGPVRGELILILRNPVTRDYEIGWVIAPSATGRGYATEAARCVLALLFQDLDAHRVHAQLDPENVASVRLCRRLGMREEARFVKDFLYEPGAAWSDTGIWAILDEEWAARR